MRPTIDEQGLGAGASHVILGTHAEERRMMTLARQTPPLLMAALRPLVSLPASTRSDLLISCGVGLRVWSPGPGEPGVRGPATGVSE